MECARCGSEMKEDWGFCPKCGSRKGGNALDDFGRDLFSQVFGRMKSSFKEIERVDNGIEKDMQAIDISPFFSSDGRKHGNVPPRGRGFSVHIKSGTGMKPRVDVKTFGGVNKENVEKQMEQKFGMKRENVQKERKISLPSFRRSSAPKVTEEPKTEVKRIGDKVSVEMVMPDVGRSEDVDIRELGSSVEVKAVAGDKAYFKILTKPENFRLTGKSFRDGCLHLEFS